MALILRVSMRHVADTRLPETNEHPPIGMGTIDFAARWALLRAGGFQGPAILEIGGLPKSGGYGRDTDEALGRSCHASSRTTSRSVEREGDLMSTSTTSTTMRAAWYERKGPAREVLSVGDLPVPEPGPGEVRVRVAVSAVNPTDTKSRSTWRGQTEMPFPRIVPHQDGAGVIDAVGAGVNPARVGERVWVYEAQWRRPFGTAAEYVVVPAGNAVRLPDGVSFADGACLGIPAMTAHRCLFADGPISGQTMLVTGAAGGVGQYAVQLAKWGGATVIATVSSAEKAAQARAIGADHVVSYRDEDVATRVLELTDGAGVDRVVEVAFGANLPTSLQLLKTNGVIATYASDAEPTPALPFGQLLWKDVTVRFVLVYVMGEAAHQAAVSDISSALEAGPLRPVTAQHFLLDEIAAAHEAMESGHTAGKLLITIGS